jgi:hypothetical protein
MGHFSSERKTMPTKVKTDAGVEVPTMEEFRALIKRVEILEQQILGPRKQTGSAVLLKDRLGVFHACVKLYWKPDKVTTDPPVQFVIYDDGFELYAEGGGTVAWTACA